MRAVVCEHLLLYVSAMWILVTILVSLSLQQMNVGESCLKASAAGTTKPLYLLALIGGDDERNVLSGAQIARDQINTRNDLLPGYHLELIFERIGKCEQVGTGLNGLAKHIFNPPTCGPIVAIIGLMCSSHASILSPVAGHDGYDLIQLSAANSPVFQTQNHHFPHFWQFLGSATAYADTVLSMMEQFKWKRVGVVYNTDSIFCTETAQYIENVARHSENHSITFSAGVSGIRKKYLDDAFMTIKNTRTAVVVILLSSEQMPVFLQQATRLGFVYPEYAWIQIVPVISSSEIEQDVLENIITGSSLLLKQTYEPQNDSLMLISKVMYREFKDMFVNNLTFASDRCNSRKINSTLNLASYLHDQVWAIALAVNNSFPVLEGRKLSIDNYTIGQHEITDVIEEQIAKLKFQGASGWIEFNQNRSVSTPVQVFWVFENGTDKHVGTFDPLNSTNFLVQLNSIDLPNDTISLQVEIILIPLPLSIVLNIVTGIVIIFTTVQLIFHLHYKHHKMIKATSPYLNLLIFAGCYFLCAAAIIRNVTASFELSPKLFIILTITHNLCTVNSMSLIFPTLFLKLVRVHYIFTAWMKKDLGQQWANRPLLSVVLILSVINNVIFITICSVWPPGKLIKCEKVQRDSIVVVEKHIKASEEIAYAVYALILGYTILVFVLVLYIGFRSRKIKRKIFNNFYQITLLLGLIVIVTAIYDTLFLTSRLRRQEYVGRAAKITGYILITLACQLILFSPKLIKVVSEDRFLNTRLALNNFIQAIKKTIFP